jgi:hypothetical protein
MYTEEKYKNLIGQSEKKRPFGIAISLEGRILIKYGS